MIAFTEEEKNSLLELFFPVAEEQTTIMSRAGGGREWKEAAHALKGAAANLGMTSLAQKCAQAERSEGLSGRDSSLLLESIREELRVLREHRQQP